MKTKVLFSHGRVVATPGAIDALKEAGDNAVTYLARHLTGDWGDCCPEDAAENDFSVANGFRILSSYHTSAGEKIWLITEHDRSYTTILLPSEY